MQGMYRRFLAVDGDKFGPHCPDDSSLRPLTIRCSSLPKSLRFLAVSFVVLIAAVMGAVPALTQAPDPCAAALGQNVLRRGFGGQGLSRQSAGPLRNQKYGRFGNDSRDVRDLLHLTAAASPRRARAGSLAAHVMADRDENHIAILEDNGGDRSSSRPR